MDILVLKYYGMRESPKSTNFIQHFGYNSQYRNGNNLEYIYLDTQQYWVRPPIGIVGKKITLLLLIKLVQ